MMLEDLMDARWQLLKLVIEFLHVQRMRSNHGEMYRSKNSFINKDVWLWNEQFTRFNLSVSDSFVFQCFFR